MNAPEAEPESRASWQSEPAQEPEAVWTFRGYRLRPSEFTTAMVHLFRAEITRANVWRSRLDATTNWAVVTTGAAITIAFNPTGHHGVIILNTLLITLFLYIEARRYRYYELWSYRVRLMETDFFAPMLVPPFHPAADWAESMAENLLHPAFPISMWEAFGRRYRRNYMWIYFIMGAAWVAKTWIFTPNVNSWSSFVAYSSVGNAPGWLVLLVGVIFNVILFLIGTLTTGLHKATGEVLPRYFHDDSESPALHEDEHPSSLHAWFRSSRRRRQLIALIITDKAKSVSDKILTEMKRGVTAIPGTGMFTGKSHTVLMCALTITEVGMLKNLVKQSDQDAFVIVSPAQEILGRGFIPLSEDH